MRVASRTNNKLPYQLSALEAPRKDALTVIENLQLQDV